MFKQLNKKALAGVSNIKTWMISFILIVVGVQVGFKLLGQTFPDLVKAGTELNTSGMPILGFLFENASAVGWYLLAIVGLIYITDLFFGSGKK